MGNSYMETVRERIQEMDELWRDCMDYYVTETYSDRTTYHVPQIPLWRRITTAIWHKLVKFAEWLKP
jgi:hypothetical protein